jgi:glycosyltransferase involved in cell wall biosynthesis
MPKVSVIVPTHNRVQFVRNAVSSVLDQIFQDFEVIVVDDASIDNTSEEVHALNDERIRYIKHERNQGGSASRNTGIKNAKGEFLAFLDDDDEWLPEKLSMQIELLHKSGPQVGCIYTGALRIEKSSQKVVSCRTPIKRGYIFDDMLVKNWIGGASTLLAKKECFDCVGLFDEKLQSSQDWDMWIRLSQKYHFDFVDKPLVRYFRHEKKISTNFDALINGKERMLEKYGNFKLKNKDMSRQYFTLGVLYCYGRDMRKGRTLLLKAIKLYPFNIQYHFNFLLSFLGANGFRRIKEYRKEMVYGNGLN